MISLRLDKHIQAKSDGSWEEGEKDGKKERRRRANWREYDRKRTLAIDPTDIDGAKGKERSREVR
jgi:hypothetical protein